MGCKKHCPAFPAELNYFPYSKGQELLFCNADDTLHFVIIRQGNSNASDYCYTSKCNDCDIFSTFTMYNNYSFELFVNISLFGMKQISGMKIISSVTTSKVFDGFEKTFEVKPVSYSEAGKYFNNTISLENEKNKIVKKVVIVKNKGLVSYTTADGEEWKLVE